MKHKKIIIGAILLTAIATLAIAKSHGEAQVYQRPPEQTTLQKRQQVWISALEWCESKAHEEAINPKDRDNTPSYGAFQFKPGTYAYFAKIIGLASTTDYMNAAGQRKIVEYMLSDPSTKWLQQFPDCVKNKIGFPPQK